MSRTERRLVIALVAMAILVVGSSMVVVGGLVAVSQGWIDLQPSQAQTVAVTSSSTTGTVHNASSVSAAPTAEPTEGPSLLQRLTSADDADLESLPLPEPDVDIGADLSTLYEQVNPGVVSVVVEMGTMMTIQGIPFTQSGSGSGFVYDDRYIVTNNHVTEGATSIEVVFFDGQRREGRLVGSDVYSDLAVIEVDNMPDTTRVLPVAQDLSDLKVGQPVVAIGNPFEKANSMTYGIVSAMGRTIPDGQTSFSIPESIQTDAAINPGNSGGPLLDLRGRVVGVNAQINTTNIQEGTGVPANSGVGFAIPATVVNRVVPHLIADGEYEWPYLGVSGNTMTADQAEAAGLSDSRGAYIQCVPSGGPSDGILQGSSNVDDATCRVRTNEEVVDGDLVVAVDGQPVTCFEDLLSYIGLHTQPGQEVRLTVLRDGREQDVTVRLGQRSDLTE